MASTKYIGYVGGVAVAAGVGAAIAVAGQGTASADTGDKPSSAASDSSSSTTSAKGSDAKAGVKTGPKRHLTKPAKAASPTKPTKAQSKLSDGVEKAVAHVSSEVNKTVSAVSKSISDSLTKPVTRTITKTAATKPAKPSPQEFEAKAVERLKGLFTPKDAAAPKPDTDDVVADKPNTKSGVKTLAATTVETAADDSADSSWDPNPLRAEDPEPTDFPEAITSLKKALLDISPDELDPLVREATEQIYRASQMVPWVNAVIPISKILPNLAPALGSGDAALDARQTLITELLKTTPPVSFVYYGYDIIADLTNLEEPAAQLKSGAVGTVWDVLDPFELVHRTGQSGI